VANFVDYPVRAAVADAAATAANIAGSAAPSLFGQPSKDRWERIRRTLLEKTEIPETSIGKAISQLASFPGESVARGVGAAAKKILGEKTAEEWGPYATVAADIGFPLGGRAIGMAREATGTVGPHSPVQRGAREASDAGYVLSPESLNESPTLTGRLLSGISGKWKKWQDLSQRNMPNTQRLAAESLGLPGNTILTEDAFRRVRGEAAADIAQMDRQVPNTATAADPEFRAEVRNIGRREERLERYYPEEAETPEIAELRARMIRDPAVPTDVVRREIAELRMQSNANFRKQSGGQGDAQARALGRAQRQAADALEHAIERSFVAGVPRISAMAEQWAAQQEVDRARANPVSGSVPPAAQARLDQANRIVDHFRRVPVDPAVRAAAAAQLDRYRAARQRMARSYDVELATNTANGEVSARALSAMRNGRVGRPLGDQLAQIADAYDAFPRELQNPSAFGHAEQLSVLDVMAAGYAGATGHLEAGIFSAARWPARAVIASPRYQRRQLADRPPFPTPIGGERLGVALMPHDDFDPLNHKLNRALQQIKERQQQAR